MSLTGLFSIKDNRIGAAEFTLPLGLKGPLPHWHQMHDKTFLTTKGTIRYHIPKPDGTEDIIDAKEGDFVTVPVRAPHTFSNPTDQEAKFYNTYTPAYYINYFKLLGTYVKEGRAISPKEHLNAVSNYATIPVPRNYMVIIHKTSNKSLTVSDLQPKRIETLCAYLLC